MITMLNGILRNTRFAQWERKWFGLCEFVPEPTQPAAIDGTHPQE